MTEMLSFRRRPFLHFSGVSLFIRSCQSASCFWEIHSYRGEAVPDCYKNVVMSSTKPSAALITAPWRAIQLIQAGGIYLRKGTAAFQFLTSPYGVLAFRSIHEPQFWPHLSNTYIVGTQWNSIWTLLSPNLPNPNAYFLSMTSNIEPAD